MGLTFGDVSAAQELAGGQCIATARGSGERCRRRSMKGTNLCVVHQPRADVRKKQPAFAAMNQFTALYDPDSPPIKDPVAELQRLGGICRNALGVVGAKVAELKEWDSYDAKGTAQLKGVVQLLLQLMRLCESILTTLAKLGIDERNVQLKEREQQLVITALRAIGTDPELALTAPQRQAWESVVPRHLRAIMASQELEVASTSRV